MADPACRDLGIPERLHRENRPAVNGFAVHELLYRRYPVAELEKSKKAPPQNLYSVALSFKRGMSVNRGKHCRHEGDVLFNEKSTAHFHLTYGVLQMEVQGLILWSSSKRTDETREYTLEVVHDPTNCMYPHSLVYLKKNGVRVDDPDGGGLKMRIKRELAKASSLKDLKTIPLPSD